MYFVGVQSCLHLHQSANNTQNLIRIVKKMDTGPLFTERKCHNSVPLDDTNLKCRNNSFIPFTHVAKPHLRAYASFPAKHKVTQPIPSFPPKQNSPKHITTGVLSRIALPMTAPD